MGLPRLSKPHSQAMSRWDLAIAARPATWACDGERNCGEMLPQVDDSGKLKGRGFMARASEARQCPGIYLSRFSSRLR
jgi:hypothetical protein